MPSTHRPIVSGTTHRVVSDAIDDTPVVQTFDNIARGETTGKYFLIPNVVAMFDCY